MTKTYLNSITGKEEEGIAEPYGEMKYTGLSLFILHSLNPPRKKTTEQLLLKAKRIWPDISERDIYQTCIADLGAFCPLGYLVNTEEPVIERKKGIKKRKMTYHITEKGSEIIRNLNNPNIEIPEILS